jgi:hypothetical protein
MNKNLIAIIDEGINIPDSDKIKYRIAITENLEVIDHIDGGIFNHADECFSIIHKYAPEAVFASIKILNENAQGLVSQLIKAIDWCVENQVHVINLSLGTTSYADFEALTATVNKAFKKGTIIIAACHNSNIVSYPAFLENVIGVRCDQEDILQGSEIRYVENPMDGIDIIANGNPVSSFESYYPANSFAAPRVTALVYNMLSGKPQLSFADIKGQLWNLSVKIKGQEKEIPGNLTARINWVECSLLISIGPDDTSFKEINFPGFVTGKLFIRAHSYSDNLLQDIEEGISKEPGTFETIILFINKGVNLNAFEEQKLIESIIKSNKRFIYLNDSTFLNHTILAKTEHIEKVWFPFQGYYEPENTNNAVNARNEIPIILIKDYCNSVQLDKISELISLINTEGYYTIALSTNSFGILFGFEYLPMSPDRAIISKHIKSLLRAFRPELMIVIEDCKNHPDNYEQILKDDLETDITINLCPSLAESGIFKTETDKHVLTIIAENSIFDASKVFSIRDIKEIACEIIQTLEPEIE